jgi:chromate transporter
MLGLTLAYIQYGSIPRVAGIFKGLGAGVVAVIAAAAWRMGRPHLKDLRAAGLMLGALLALLLFQANVVLLVIFAGVAGMLLFRTPSDLQPEKKTGGLTAGQGGGR